MTRRSHVGEACRAPLNEQALSMSQRQTHAAKGPLHS